MKQFERIAGLSLGGSLVAVVVAMLASVASFGFVVALYASASGELDMAMDQLSAAVAAAGGSPALPVAPKAKPG